VYFDSQQYEEEKILQKNAPAHNRQFGASGGVASWDTSQDFGSSAPVRALPIPPPVAKLLKRCLQACGHRSGTMTTKQESADNFTENNENKKTLRTFVFEILTLIKTNKNERNIGRTNECKFKI